jgi:glutathione S-transferase
MNDMHWPALVTLAALALCFATAAIVGRARVKYRIPAPATTGHEMFERAFRVQMNTLESAVIFFPALWLCAIFFGPLTATGFGVLWLVGRIWYAAAYLREPKSRGSGFVLAFAAWGGLMIAASCGVLRGLFGA